ncbi:hypothetical protein Tco_1458790 [Tanacetum coccineum]
MDATTTFDAFPSNIPTFSSATCRWGNISPAKCHWEKVDGDFSPKDMSLGKGPLSLTFHRLSPRSFVLLRDFPQRHAHGEKSAIFFYLYYS